MRTVFLVGGGTGGHLYPMVALAEYLQSDKSKVLLVGLQDRLDASMLATVAVDRYLQPLPRPGTGLGKLWFAVVASGLILQWVFRLNRLDVVVSSGGYSSLPILIAALVRRNKIILYEPNGIDGKVIRLILRCGSQKLISVQRPLCDGSPPLIRSMASPEPRQVTQEAITKRNALLVVGGSQGSAILNTMVRQVWAALLEQKKIERILWITGTASYEEVSKEVHDARVEILPYCHDMKVMLAQARAAIVRSGAGTVIESALWNIPAVYVPLSWAADNHQTLNAEAAVSCGWGVIVQEGNSQALAPAVAELLKKQVFTPPAQWWERERFWREKVAA